MLGHFDNDIADGDGFVFGYFRPFAGFNHTIAKNMAVFDQHFGLSSRIDEIKNFDQFVEFNSIIFECIGHENGSFTNNFMEVKYERRRKTPI